MAGKLKVQQELLERLANRKDIGYPILTTVNYVSSMRFNTGFHVLCQCHPYISF